VFSVIPAPDSPSFNTRILSSTVTSVEFTVVVVPRTVKSPVITTSPVSVPVSNVINPPS